MVQSPLLAVQGRKFSLRVYVVYFLADGSLPSEVYVSSEGLVKIASMPLTADDTRNPRQHMTNSGREAFMQQESFTFLQSKLPSGHFDDRLWSSIQRAIRCVMTTTNEHDESCDEQASNDLPDMTIYRKKLGRLGLPKILGFDFVADTSLNAWLVEANRFPGLEPRDTHTDSTVKYQVVLDAWAAATLKGRKRVQLALWLLKDFAKFKPLPLLRL